MKVRLFEAEEKKARLSHLPVAEGATLMSNCQPADEKADILSRRFQAYNVGIARTGTTSIAGIFDSFYSGHEFMFQETTKAIADYSDGVISEGELRTYILHRDKLGMLEMDSASFSFFYVDVLAKEFPSAKFIFTIRDCYSWLDSVLNLTLHIGARMPYWMLDYGQRALGINVTSGMLRSRDDFLCCLPDVIDGFLNHWASANRLVLQKLPADRSLIIRTNDISTSIHRISKLMDIPIDELSAENSHLFRARKTFNLLREVNYELLHERFDHYCSDIMDSFFVGYTLRDFLKEERKDVLAT